MTSRPAQIYSLQILRGVAATSVAYIHTFTPPQFGLFGVDLFFVISGFVMFMIVEQSYTTPLDFILSRVARIVPLYWGATTLVLLTAWLAPSLMRTTVADIGNYILSLLFIPHFREDGQLMPMLMQGWSLDYEMVFYGTIFLVVAVNRALFFYGVSAVLALYYVMGTLAPQGSVVNVFFQTTLWGEFVLGMGAYAIYRNQWIPAIPQAVIFPALAILFGILIAAEGKGDRLLTAGVPSVLVLLLSLQLEGWLRSLRAWILKLLVNIGDASYATYLSHMFVIGFVERIIFARLGIEKNTLTALFTVLCCLAAGSLIYYLLDKPISVASRRLAKRLAAQYAAPENS